MSETDTRTDDTRTDETAAERADGETYGERRFTREEGAGEDPDAVREEQVRAQRLER